MKLLSPSLPLRNMIAINLLLGAAGLLTGCGIGAVDTSTTPETVSTTITGRVHGGEQPISGSTISLYVTGTSGYGSGATTLIASTTSNLYTGTFTFPTANVPANCTGKGPYAYITASGGDPSGLTTTTSPGWTGGNHAILLAAMLGTCSSVGSSTYVDMDEVTTVAAAYTLGNFATVSGAAGTTATLDIGAPASNTQGLADAVANAALLVNTTSGTANASTSTVMLPTAAINSLANTMSVCVNSTEYNTGQCPTVFSLATPPGGSEPSNIFQALMNIAKYPGQNVAAILGEISTTPPFAPALTGGTTSSTVTSVLNDLSLGIAYSNSTLAGASTAPIGITIDKNDNVWVTGAQNSSSTTSTSKYNYLGELTSASAGNSYTATLGSTATTNVTHTIRTGAFDNSGNLWLTDKNNGSSYGSVIEVPSGSTFAAATEQSTFTTLSSGIPNNTLDPNDYYLAVDASGDIWTASYGGPGNCEDASNNTGTGSSPVALSCEYVEYSKSGSSYTPVNIFDGGVFSSPTVRGIAVDTVSTSAGLGSVWTANYATFGASTSDTVEVLAPSTGTLSTYTLGTSTSELPFGIITDKTGGAYVTTYGTGYGGLYYIAQGTANGSTISSVSTTGTATTLANIPNVSSAPASTSTATVPLGGFNNPGYIAIDGAQNVWVANNNYGTIIEYSPSLYGYLSPYYGFAPSIATTSLPANQSLFTCTTSGTAPSTTTACTFPAANGSTTAGLVYKKSLISIAIDRAGSVWSMDSAGTLVEILGTAAPANPILAAGATGTLP
jgi:hypothetical protein